MLMPNAGADMPKLAFLDDEGGAGSDFWWKIRGLACFHLSGQVDVKC